MAIDEGLVDWVIEAMEPVGTITRNRLFGGVAIYCDGMPFAIVHRGALWFKADAHSNARWDALGAERLSTTRDDGRVSSINYRQAPEACYDDPDVLRQWAALALEAARRAPPKR